MTDDRLAAILANPLTKKPWDAAAKWLKANGHPDAARRVKVWADARKALRAALSWDRPATLDATAAAANALPDERCRRLYVSLFGWIAERFPPPPLGFPEWRQPWSSERARLVQALAALGAVEPSALDDANRAVDYAYEAGTGEAECAADDTGEAVARWVRSASGSAVREAAAAMQYSLTVLTGTYQGQNVEPTVAGHLATCAARAAGESAAAAVWAGVLTAATATGLDDQSDGEGESPAYQWAVANGVPEAAAAATADARAAACAGLHSLAAWDGWATLAGGLN